MIRFFSLATFVLLLFSCAKEKSVDTMGDNPTLPPPASTDTCLLTRFVQGTHVGDDTILRISYNSKYQITSIIDSSEMANDGDSIDFVYNASGQLTEMNYPRAMEKYRYVYNGTLLEKLIYVYESPFIGYTDTIFFVFNNGRVSKTINKIGYSEFQWDSKGNIIRILNEGYQQYNFKYIIISYTNDANALRPLADINYAMNLTDLRNFAFPELGWCANNVEKMTFYDENNQVWKTQTFNYQKDSTGKVIKIESVGYYPGDPDPNIYTYHLEYGCK